MGSICVSDYWILINLISFLAQQTDMEEGKIGCMKRLGITESWAVKRQVVLSASEAAEMILRVDNILKAAPRKRVPDRGHC